MYVFHVPYVAVEGKYSRFGFGKSAILYNFLSHFRKILGNLKRAMELQ
jgi:hypothetical protein